jgi:tetratricopeptide (TPR) repeat protein
MAEEVIKRSPENDAHYYLALASSFLNDISNFIAHRAIKGKIKVRLIKDELENALAQIDKAEQLDPKAHLEEFKEGEKVDCNFLRAKTYFLEAQALFEAGEKPSKILEACQKSLNYFQSQHTMYLTAMAIEKQGGTKAKSETVEAYQKVVNFDPYSDLGLSAAKKIIRMQKQVDTLKQIAAKASEGIKKLSASLKR